MKLRTIQELRPRVSVEPRLDPAVRFDLEAGVGLYTEAQELIERGEAQKLVSKDILEEALETGGIIRAAVSGHVVQWVFPTRTSLDERKLMAQGVTLRQIENARVTTPGKPYISVKPTSQK